MTTTTNLFEIIKEKNNASVVRDGKLTALMYEKNNSPVMAVWRGKQRKPFYHYRHRSLETMYQTWEYIKEQERKNEKAKAEHKEKRKQENEQMKKTMKVGDIFYTSWGYEQTNVDFFQVTEIKGQFATFRMLQKDVNEKHGWLSGTCKRFLVNLLLTEF